jgi:hypothetical protein
VNSCREDEAIGDEGGFKAALDAVRLRPVSWLPDPDDSAFNTGSLRVGSVT